MDSFSNQAAWTPQFASAIEEAKKASCSAVYLTKDDIDLELCTDKEPWQPSIYIQELMPHWNDIEMIDIKTADLNQVRQVFLEEGRVGLIVMGQIVNRRSKPACIVLTTKNRYYLVDPDDRQKSIRFLMVMLADKRLKFFTTNGVNESDSLYGNYGIDLSRSQAICCTGLHIYLMRTMRYKPDAALKSFPVLAQIECKREARLECFEKMVEIWLDISKNDLYQDQSQQIHLGRRPLSLTAKNVILKRCLLALVLADRLEHFCKRETQVMSNNTFACHSKSSQSLAQITQKSRQPLDADMVYYAHMDGVESG